MDFRIAVLCGPVLLTIAKTARVRATLERD